mgnify:CR=1 FL=1
MRAALLHNTGDEKLEIIDDLEVDAPGPGEVTIKIEATGVCHSDLHAMQGSLPQPAPFVPGHEGAGTISAVGDGVTDLAVGDHVVVAWSPPCGKCNNCVERKQPHLCVMIQFAIAGTPRFTRNGEPVFGMAGTGTFAEYLTVPQEAAVKIFAAEVFVGLTFLHQLGVPLQEGPKLQRDLPGDAVEEHMRAAVVRDSDRELVGERADLPRARNAERQMRELLNPQARGRCEVGDLLRRSAQPAHLGAGQHGVELLVQSGAGANSAIDDEGRLTETRSDIQSAFGDWESIREKVSELAARAPERIDTDVLAALRTAERNPGGCSDAEYLALATADGPALDAIAALATRHADQPMLSRKKVFSWAECFITSPFLGLAADSTRAPCRARASVVVKKNDTAIMCAGL